jgi:hypothetical protein
MPARGMGAVLTWWGSRGRVVASYKSQVQVVVVCDVQSRDGSVIVRMSKWTSVQACIGIPGAYS